MFKRIKPSILLLVLSEVLLLGLFPARLILEHNIAAGGDTPVHFLTAIAMSQNLRHFFSPVVWVNGAFGGFPLFLNYFPLPFALMALLGKALPLQVAFKLVTLLAVIPLPAAVYFCLLRLGGGKYSPGIGALLSLLFLLTTDNSMWGGNIFSTLAGEFAFSLSFILYVIFTGKIHSDIEAGRSPNSGSIIEALMVLCSGYPALQAAAGSTYFLLRGGGFKYLLRLHGAAAGLAAFWLLPLLWRLPWNTSYSFSWYFHSRAEVIPPLLWPSLAGVAAPVLLGAFDFFRSGRKISAVLKDSLDSPELYLLWQFAAAMICFSLASSLGLVDARFLPFARISVVLLGALGWERLLSRLPKPGVCLCGFCAAAVLVALASAPAIDRWIAWNYSGLECKPLWKSFRKVNDCLKGDENRPRVACEHNEITNAAGTVRAFELLPFFSGRSTLGGLYMQSALNAPFVYYLRSELAEAPTCPLEEYYYSRPDPGRAAPRLRLFNVSEVVAVSEDMADALSLSPDYELSGTFAPFTIFRVKGCADSYVEPLRFRPLRVSAKNWKKTQFDWFRKSSLNVPLVVALKKTPEGFLKTLAPYGGDPARIPEVPIPGSGDVRAKAVFEKGNIIVDTSKPGFPLLVKVSYHPDWRITAGKGELHLASPAFMLLVPQTPRVVLTFDTAGGIYRAGRIFFFLTVVALALEALRGGISRFSGRRGRGGPAPPGGGRFGKNGRFFFFFALTGAVVAAAISTRDYRDPVLLHHLAVAEYERNGGEAPLRLDRPENSGSPCDSPRTLEVLKLFDTCMSRFDHSVVFDNCEAYKARVMAGRRMWGDLRPMLARYLEENPDSRMYAQALFWLGEASLRTGGGEDAKRFFREALFTWPPNEAVRQAGFSLAKILGDREMLKTAGELYSSGKYLEAYNVYSALGLSTDAKTREETSLPLAWCAARLNRPQEACDLFVRWLSSNFNAPGAEEVKAELGRLQAAIAHDEEQRPPAPQ